MMTFGYLSALVAALIGFVAAANAIAKLVTDKEQKVSDYRQQWNDSLRSSIADFTSKARAIAYVLKELSSYIEQESQFRKKLGEYQRQETELEHQLVQNSIDKMLPAKKAGVVRQINQAEQNLKVAQEQQKILDAKFIETREELYFAIDFLKLHFKPKPIKKEVQAGTEDEFWEIETKIQPLLDKLNQIHILDDPRERDGLLEEVKKEIDQIVTDFRTILKNVWERVKKGEEGFNKTKTIMISLAVLSALLAAIFIYTNSTKSDSLMAKDTITNDQYFLRWDQMMRTHLQSCSQETVSKNSPNAKLKPIVNKAASNEGCKCK